MHLLGKNIQGSKRERLQMLDLHCIKAHWEHSTSKSLSLGLSAKHWALLFSPAPHSVALLQSRISPCLTTPHLLCFLPRSAFPVPAQYEASATLRAQPQKASQPRTYGSHGYQAERCSARGCSDIPSFAPLAAVLR